MLFKSHGHSDVGFVRENNEDSFVVDDAKGIFAVADGVGGLPFGNLASRLAVRFFASMIRSSEDACNIEELMEIVQKVHANVVECGQLVGGENGIGTTFSALRLLPDKILYVHVGDSAIFRKSGDSLTKISKSHTLGDELIEKHGPQAADDMPEHHMHTLTRCMGQDIDFEVDSGEIGIEPNDQFLICSDGVTNMVDLGEIQQMMSEYEPNPFVHALIDAANQNGGVDNSTAISLLFS